MSHLTGVSGVLRRTGTKLHVVSRTPRPRVGRLLKAHLPQTQTLGLGEVQGSDPQAHQTGQDHHEFLSGHGPVGDSMTPVSLQATDLLCGD